MSNMQDDFDSGLREGFEDANKAREGIKFVRGLIDEAPEVLAARIAAAIPRGMEELREHAAKKWGVDISDLDNLRDGEINFCKPPEMFELLSAINVYRVYAEALLRIEEHVGDPSLSSGEVNARVCEVGLQVTKGFEAAKLHVLREIRIWFEKNGTEKAAREAKDAEARYLAGHLATKTSPNTNLRLAKALDEIREHKKPRSREWFELLLRELYVLAPDAWAEYHRTDWGLSATRTATVKKIEQRLVAKEASLTDEIDLATFAEREALLQKGREAGLTPREYELFKLYVQKPHMKYREAAEKLGISVGAVGALKSRIKKALNAA